MCSDWGGTDCSLPVRVMLDKYREHKKNYNATFSKMKAKFGPADAKAKTLAMFNHLTDLDKGMCDQFNIYTDNDTWAGKEHVCSVMKRYRNETGIPAKLATIATIASDSTICDPKDPNSADFVGFDSNTPRMLYDFTTGALDSVDDWVEV